MFHICNICFISAIFVSFLQKAHNTIISYVSPGISCLSITFLLNLYGPVLKAHCATQQFSSAITKTAKQGCITVAAREIEFGKTKFYANGGKLFCRSCNFVVNHIRKDTIDKHIKSKKDSTKVLTISEVSENRATRRQTLKTAVNARTDISGASCCVIGRLMMTRG